MKLTRGPCHIGVELPWCALQVVKLIEGVPLFQVNKQTMRLQYGGAMEYRTLALSRLEFGIITYLP